MYSRDFTEIGWQAFGRGGGVAAGGREAVEAGLELLSQGGMPLTQLQLHC